MKLSRLLAALSIAFIALYLVVSLLRIGHPYELEWMEGGMREHVERVLRGQPLYVEPTVDFVPFIYTPLFYWVSAAMAKVVGHGFLPMRLVSFLASLGCGAILFRFVARETKNRLAALAAVGLFAASYHRGGEFFDLARVDSLNLVLTLAALYFVRFSPSVRGQLLAALLFVLAFLAKQSTTLVMIPIVVHAVIVDRRRSLPLVVATIVGVVSTTLLLDARSEGWFRFYVFELPRRHPIERMAVLGFFTADIAPYLIAVAAGAFFLITRPSHLERRARFFYFFASAGMLGEAYSARLHTGGWQNVLIPGFAWLAVVFGIGLDAALRAIEGAPPSPDETTRARLRSFVLVAAIAQLAFMSYDPRPLVPRRKDVEAGRRLVETLRAIDGDVYLPAHGYLAALAGKPSFAHQMAVDDVVRGDNDNAGPALRLSVAINIMKRRFSAIATDNDWWFMNEIGQRYQKRGEAIVGDGLYPVAGIHVRPEQLWVPKPGS